MASQDQGVIIAKRSVSLSKTYPIIGSILGCFSIVLARIPELVSNNSPQSGLSTNATAQGTASGLQSVSYISIPLEVIGAILFATPVLLLYVYDKNNGVLEYFLSLGMDQATIYKQYLKGALVLTSIVLVFEVSVSIIAGLLLSRVGDLSSIAIVPLIGVAIGFPVVAFTTIAMISFSSLQKQRVGSNQPLGLALGTAPVLPTYITPLVDPSLAETLDLLIAAAIAVVAVVFFLLSSKLIKREKLLP